MFHRAFIAFSVILFTRSAFARESGSLLPSNGRFVLPAAVGAQLLDQCSRNTPQQVTEFWRPEEAEINRLEGLLGPYLATRQKSGRRLVPPKPWSYHRQYIGLIKGGARFIYGNFYPWAADRQQKTEWATPVVICDGGPLSWGIVFSPDTGRFEEPEFNGDGLAAVRPGCKCQRDPREADDRDHELLWKALENFDQSAAQRLRKGMMPSEVKRPVGKPNSREKLAARVELWRYGTSPSGTVTYVVAFLDGKLEFYGEANPQWWDLDDYTFEGGERLQEVLRQNRNTPATEE